mgnify:FL=1
MPILLLPCNRMLQQIFKGNVMKALSRQLGFTLVEMMVAIAIIAMLASIALPSYTKYIEKGDLVNARSKMVNIADIIKTELVKKPSYLKNKTEAALNTEITGMIDGDLKAKYTFTTEFIMQGKQNEGYPVGIRIYALPQKSGYSYTAWVSSQGASYSCMDGTRDENIAAAKAFQTSAPCK